MLWRVWVLVGVVVLAGAGCSFKPLVLTPKAATPDGVAPVVVHAVPTVLVLDGSGSMNTDDAPGPRIDAAKAAAHNLIKALPEDARIGLQTYGTTTGSAPDDKPAGCRDVTTLIPLGPLNRGVFTTKIDTITPSGYTPISLALTTAADQLPADTRPQAIVVVSDGEDTCDTPPCDTAAALKKTHPGLAISTVGFKLDGPAADQLRCIATATGGLFVTASNATQLTTRLLATQNIDQANQSLSATGMNGIELGNTIGDIRTAHPDFPEATTTGAVTITWHDCDYDFLDGALDAIRPHNGGRTVDGLTTGSPVTKATELYGPPLATTPNNDNTTTLIYDADPKTPNAYQITVSDYNTTGTNTPTGTITTITLCKCKPQVGPAQSLRTSCGMVAYPTDGTTGYVIVQNGQLSCDEAMSVIDRYLNDPTLTHEGNTWSAQFGKWLCASPTATASQIEGYSTSCMAEDGQKEIRIITSGAHQNLPSADCDSRTLLPLLLASEDTANVPWEFGLAEPTCDGDWAMAWTTSKDPGAQSVGALFHRVNGAWQYVTLGSNWDCVGHNGVPPEIAARFTGCSQHK